MDTVQKLPTNSESNIMRCSTVPRFKYLPIRWSTFFFMRIIYLFMFIEAFVDIFVFYWTSFNFALWEFCFLHNILLLHSSFHLNISITKSLTFVFYTVLQHCRQGTQRGHQHQHLRMMFTQEIPGRVSQMMI